MKKPLIMFLIPIIIGLFAGYLILHPASVLIFHVFEKKAYDLIQIVRESFSLEHFAMSTYFSIIGGVIGSIIAVYIVNIINTNVRLFDIVTRLKSQNRQLQNRISTTALNNKEIAKRIRPDLNKIENGVEMITNQSTGGLSMRQSALLSITKDNIDHLYEIIESLIVDISENCEEKIKI